MIRLRYVVEVLLKLAKQFEDFRDNLEKFAEKHKDEIRKDVVFRRQFQEMCATVGVDPLACKLAPFSSSSFVH